VHVAARADAFDDLLAEVAAFGEVQGAGLGGLLREVVGCSGVADVGAVAGRAFEDTELVEGFGGDGCCAGGDEVCCKLLDCGWIGPQFDARDQGAVSVDDVDGFC
jgi:hypothetical protein